MCWLFCVSLLFFTFATSDTKLLEKLSKIKWQCANENCSEPIAEGYSFKFYNGVDPLELNFNINDNFLILGKSNDKAYNYWLVQAGEKKGIVPVEYVRERDILINQRNQIVTELDLGSIIQSIQVERTSKEAIKPSAPQLVVDGTTLPPYEDDGFSSDVVVEDESEEEVFVSPQSQEIENPSVEASSDQGFVNSGTLETDGNQNSFVGREVEGLASNNVNITDDFIGSTIENSTNLETNGTETSQEPRSSMPTSDPVLKYDSQKVPKAYSYVSNNNEYNHKDIGSLEPSLNADPLNPEQDQSSVSIAEVTAGSDSPPLVQDILDQPNSEKSVPEILPADNSVDKNEASSNQGFVNSGTLETDGNQNNFVGREVEGLASNNVNVPDDLIGSTIENSTNLETNGTETSQEPRSSMPTSDPVLKYDSQEVPKAYSYVSNNNEYNHKDIGSSEPSLNVGPLNPEQDQSSASIAEVTAGSDSLPLVQDILDQSISEKSFPEILPADNSVYKNDNDRDNSASNPQTEDETVDTIQEGDSWFSGISSVMNSFTEMFAKSDIGVDKDVSTTTEENVISPEKIESQQCDDEGKLCGKESDSSHWKDSSANDNEIQGSTYVSEMFGSFSETQMSLSTLVCLVITSIVVLLFSLGYYYLENLKQDTSLVAKINTVSTELFFAQKELASIEEQYQLANENYRKLVSETSNNEKAIEELRKELEESKAARGALEDEIKRLEKEIESLVEEGDEMHRMLAESFSEEERTKSLLANISDLKGVLSERLQEIVSLTEQLDNEKQEVELLTISLKKSEEKREATEDKLTKVLNDADSKTLAVTKEFEEKISTLERIIEERSLERTNFEKQICELKGTCELLMVEKELAEKELKKAHGVSSGKALSEWLEAKQIRTDLLTVQKETEKLSQALEEAKNRGALLEEKEKQLLQEIVDLNNKYEEAEKEKIDALTRLQVLSNYFKESEIKLQEELGIKEAQWLQKQSEDHSIYEQMRSLREENLSYKAQNEALKKEIIDQEASFKIQIANEEQKAQENWINLRHTERRLKEVQMEAAHLRSRLTALEANPDSLEDKHKSLEMNGDVSMGAASPPFMLYHPPPDYIPPPPLVSPTRPPPLGRLSSPPLTPPAPLSPFEFYPPPPPSPPPPLRVHKPQPREHHRKQKDSQSSNHSSESAEKPIRRGKR